MRAEQAGLPERREPACTHRLPELMPEEPAARDLASSPPKSAPEGRRAVLRLQPLASVKPFLLSLRVLFRNNDLAVHTKEWI